MNEEFRIDPTIAYDIVEFPSKGIHYANRKKTVRVAYLTAADENILASPNVINSPGGVVNELLKRKILDRDIAVEDIVEEDKQAILIFLRNTSFGTEYNMTLTDPKTQKKFSVPVDLSVLKVKDFTLVEDPNGEYPYFMEKCKIHITFKFLTQKQEDELKKMKDTWTEGIPPVKTKEREMMIKSVNGNRDMMEIHNFIERMPIKDSQDFRKYVAKNKPGLDLTQEVTTPSGDVIQAEVVFGVEFFRPFYGI
jgi:hypothetical protein